MRHYWQGDSIVFLNNRGTQHYAVPDYHKRRIRYRVTIKGDRLLNHQQPAESRAFPAPSPSPSESSSYPEPGCGPGEIPIPDLV
jgi:hypothetical protein